MYNVPKDSLLSRLLVGDYRICESNCRKNLHLVDKNNTVIWCNAALYKQNDFFLVWNI
jgi:hypothetical protein